MIKHINLNISGRVQGVWFRASAQKQAVELGLRGFVCNLPGGSVYAECEGDEAQLAAMIAWCWQGPPLALVDKVEVFYGPVAGFDQFEIR